MNPAYPAGFFFYHGLHGLKPQIQPQDFSKQD